MTQEKMLSFSPEELSERDNYKFLIGSVIPRPIALVSTIYKEGIVNIAPFSYFNIVSANPPILSVAIQRKDGEFKDTARNLMTEGSAVIHIVDEDNVKDGNQTAANLPASTSELEQTNFTPVHSETVGAKGLAQAKIRFETTLLEKVTIENEGQETADLFLLKIKHYHIADRIYKEGRIDPDLLQAVSRLAGNDYATIGERFTIDRPD